MRYIKTLLLVLLSANISFSQIDRTKPPQSGPAPIISLGNPKSFTLKNGLKVIVVENDKLPRAYANLDIDNYPDYEGDKKGGILSIVGWGIIFTSFFYLKCSGIEYVDGVKDYSNYSTNPFIVLPLIAGLYGAYLIIRKAFKLAYQFENAED